MNADLDEALGVLFARMDELWPEITMPDLDHERVRLLAALLDAEKLWIDAARSWGAGGHGC